MNAQLMNRESVYLATITPSFAKRLLEHNTMNRPLVQQRIKKFAGDMKRGAWQNNGETIKVAKSGRVLDGQHRLHAVIQSGVSITSLIVEGLEEDSFHTIDTGSKRTNAQILGINGIKNANQVASAARWASAIENKTLNPGDISSQNTFEIVERHPLIIVYVTKLAAAKSARALFPSGGVGVLALAAEKYGEDIVDSFFDSFNSAEGLVRTDPVYQLRERLISNKAGVARLHTSIVVALIIKAIRAYALGRPIGVLRWSQNEQVPEL